MAGRLGRQLGLLREAPGFRLLFAATFASSFGSLLAVVALAIDVKDRTDSGAWVGALMIVEFLPAVIIGLTLGPLFDRLSRRGLMIGADLVRLAVFCALPFAPGAGTIVALAAVAGLATWVFRPAALAGVPNLVEDERLPAANALLQTVENLSWALGPIAGGILTAAAGPHLAYWLNAATFLVSAMLIARIPSRLLRSEEPITRGHWRDVAEGLALVRRSRALLTVLVAWSVALFGVAGTNVAEVFLAKDVFHAGDFGYGLLYGSSGVGLVLGSFFVPGLVERRRIAPVYLGSLTLMALGTGLAAISPNVWVAALLVGINGIGNGGAGVCNILLVQRGAPDRLRGRAFTVVMSINFAALALGMAAVGPLVDSAGARWVWASAGLILGMAALLGYTLARRVPSEPVTQPHDLEVGSLQAETGAPTPSA